MSSHSILRAAWLVFFLIIGVLMPAQTLTQTVRGTVTDKQVKSPLPGAIVQLLNSTVGTTTDVDGNFKLEQVPVGRQSFRITYIGYKEVVLNDVDVSSGKEVVLNIELEEQVNKEVVITTDKKKPLNGFSSVSARTFSVEETQRYAAAVNDPARAAMAFPGVVAVSDGNNNISIRGNMPNGLLWRMEGIEVPNPNHFSSIGSAGGGISILSAQLLSNSDFVTGAFAAEYGNAISGVFDLRLRRGNNERHEFTFQAGVLGIDAAAEGPFSAKHRGSYLINYRYSTLGILNYIGVLGDGGITTFQDLSFNFVMPTEKHGTFTLFGFGGLSSEKYNAATDSSQWETEWKRYTSRFFSNTGAIGLTWGQSFGERTFLKIAMAASANGNGYHEKYLQDNLAFHDTYFESYYQEKLTLSGTVTHKFNANHSIRSGIILNELGYNLQQRYYDDSLAVMIENLKGSGTTQTLQAFSQWQFRPTEKITTNIGVHALALLLNGTYSVEPRASVAWEFLPSQTFSIGYGSHSQVLPLAVYFVKEVEADGEIAYPNKNLELLRAQHLVLSYDKVFGQNFRLKVEAYEQWLKNVPVKNDPHSSYALLNEIYGSFEDSLVSKGTGKNKGIELTLEKFFSKGSYFLLSGSLFSSQYKALDGVWRNTRFNSQYAVTFTGGKEFTLSEKRKGRVIGLNAKLMYIGGFFDTPIDLQRSQETGGTWRDDAHAFTEKMPDYFRADIRLSLKRNHQRWTSTVSLDIQNVTNRKNVFNKYFDAQQGEIVYNYQAPLIPVLSYRVEF